MDESQPLLRNITPERHQQAYTNPLPDEDGGADIAETIIVDFDPLGDPDNPLEWPTPFKWTVVSMLAFMAFTVTMTCMSVVPLASRIVDDLTPPNTPSSSTKSASVLLVTIWELGEAAGPLFIAPLSEQLGRYPTMNGANLLFVAATVLAATSATIPRLVLARMLTGLAVASNVLGPAIVGDIFPQEHRGAALSLVYLAPLLGGAMGPLISSAVAQAWGWRAVVWMTVGLASGCEVLFLTYFRETYKVAILRRRAARLALLAGGGDDKGGASGDARQKRFKTAFDEAERGEARGEEEGLWAVGKLRDAVLRPGLVLCGSGVLVALTVFSAVVFTYFYIMSTTLSDILQDIYGLTPVATGFCFMSFSAGSFIGVVICNRTLDRIYIRMTNTHKGVGKPEFRLPLAIIGAFTLPLTVGAYGWVAELRLPLVFLLLSVSCMGTTLMLGMLPVTAYVVDAFGLYSASAMTSVIVTRCLMSTFLPLATPALVDAFGYGWGFMAFTGLGLLLAPIPVLMLRYGAHWRRSSKYTREA